MLNSEVFKAIAHPVRRDILKRRRADPVTAGELAKAYAMSKPSLSAHFKVLKAADLVSGERDGNFVRYHLNVTVAEELLAAMMELLRVDPSTATESADVPVRERL